MTTLGAPKMMRPAYLQGETSSSGGSAPNTNPFYTPMTSHAELAAQHSRQNSNEALVARTEEPMPEQRQGRPLTPLMHEMMRGGNGGHNANANNNINNPISPVGAPQRQSHHNMTPMNPFASPEDEDLERGDYTPPWIPSKSPERRNSPKIHYPSGPEVQNFDFGLHPGYGPGHDVNEDGGDGWRRPTVGYGH